MSSSNKARQLAQPGQKPWQRAIQERNLLIKYKNDAEINRINKSTMRVCGERADLVGVVRVKRDYSPPPL